MLRARAVMLACGLACASNVAHADGPGPGTRDDEKPWTESLRLSGFVQTDWVVTSQSAQDELDGATGAPLNTKRFLLRRGHLRVDYDPGGAVFGAFELDANTVNGPQLRPIDAEASLRWPPRAPDDDAPPIFVASVGLMRIPFGFEVQERDVVRPFLERATVLRALFPGEFDLGARFRLRWRALDLALALMNGDPIGERAFPGRDPSQSKDMVGRVGLTSNLTPEVRVEAGLSAVTGTGFHAGTPATKDSIVWRDTNEDGIVQSTEIQAIAGSASTPSQTFRRFGLGADARARANLPMVGELTLRAEVIWAKNLDRGIMIADPVGTGRDLRELGWYVGATQEISRWAMVGVRYDVYDPDADASRLRGAALVPSDATFTTVAAMAMLRYYETARLTLEYDHNTNPLGRTTSGAPTTLKNDALTLRAQVTF